MHVYVHATVVLWYNQLDCSLASVMGEQAGNTASQITTGAFSDKFAMQAVSDNFSTNHILY